MTRQSDGAQKMTYNLKEIKKLSFSEIISIASDSETESKTLLQIIRV